MASPINSLDSLISRLGSRRGQSLSDAARVISDGDPYLASRDGQIADELLRQPKAMARVDEFLGDNGLLLGGHIGAGAESLVFDAIPRSGDEIHVLKVRPDSDGVDVFDHPADVPGVAPYWAVAQASPNIAAGLQQKAVASFRPKQGLELPFSHGASRLGQSLLARGWHWGDGHKWNVGVMPDRTWGAIDGFIDRAHPSWTLPKYSHEEAIRMLRLTPDEQAAIFGTDGLTEP